MKGNAVLHLFKFILGTEEAETQTSARERAAIAKYAAGKKQAVEIGVFEGVNTVLIAQSLEGNGQVFGIDPFFKGSLGICYHKSISKLNLKRNKVSGKVQLIEKLSFDAVTDVPAKVEFIFIDGDHSYEGISRDWDLYADKLLQGGIMALHDTTVPDKNNTANALGSVHFFNEVISKDQRYEWLETVDSMNVLRRK